MKTKFLSFLFAFMFVGMKLMAVDIIVGTGTSSSYSYPYITYYKYSTEEFIYKASEIGGPGTINGISFYVNTATSQTATINVYLGHTSLNSLSSQITSGMTCVYNSSRTIGSSTGWEYLSFSTPFYYNGVNNLVVIVTKSCSSYNNSLTYRYSTGQPTGLYRSSDGTTDYATWNYFGGFSTTTNRPNIKFNIPNYIKGFKRRKTDYDFTVNEIYYKVESLNDLTCKVVGGNGYTQTTLDIPSTVTFNGRELRVVGIDDYAFTMCNIESITIPNSVTSIGKLAFGGSKLKSLILPDEMSSISDSLAYACSQLSSISIGAGTQNIGKDAFMYCISLTDVTIPSGVDEIGNSAFMSCDNLKTVTLNSNEFVSKTRTSSYPLSAIFGQQVTKYILGDNVEEIGSYSFYQCSNITQITLPSKLETIGDYAFYGCTGLTNIVIPNNIDKIQESTFQNCTGLTSVIIPNRVDTISNYAFSGCTKLSKVVFEDGKKTIHLGRNGDVGAFNGIQIKNLYLGRNVDYESGYQPFKNNTSLQTLTIGNRVTEFPDNSLSTITSLTELNIGDGLTMIPSFNTCTKLKKVSLGLGLYTIPSFKACEVIDTIYLHSSIPQQVEEEFTNKIYINSILKVPTGSLAAYQSAEIWENFWNVSEYTYEGADNLKIICPKNIIRQGATMALTAKLYPGGIICNNVVWRSTDDTIATITPEGIVTGINIGSTSIIATTTTDEGANLSDTCAITVNASYKLGDVNDDGYVNVADISGVINFIMETNTESLIFGAADINKDNIVLVDDLTDLITMILHPNQPNANAVKYRSNLLNIVNRCNADIMIRENENNVIEFILADEFDQYSGLQFDLALPSGYIVENVISDVADDVQNTWSLLSENEYRIMLYSPSNTAFYVNAEKKISVKYTAERGDALGSVALCNIVATTPVSNAVYMYDCNFTLDHATSIQSTNVAHGEKTPIYNLAGQRVRYPQTGIYIKDGKKLIRK